MRSALCDHDAPVREARSIAFALTAITIVLLVLGVGGCSRDADEPTDMETAPASTAETSSVIAPGPVTIDEDAGPLMAEKVAAFVRGYMTADVDLLVSAVSESNAETLREVAPALEMGGPIGEVTAETETPEGLLLETLEEGETTYVLVPLTAEGLTLVATTWQGATDDRSATQETTYTFVLENGGYRIDRIDGAPASSVLVQ